MAQFVARPPFGIYPDLPICFVHRVVKPQRRIEAVARDILGSLVDICVCRGQDPQTVVHAIFFFFAAARWSSARFFALKYPEVNEIGLPLSSPAINCSVSACSA